MYEMEDEMKKETYNNPILPGFYPDPTICKVGSDYYLANSTFAYFPGVPIFHSKDLVHWNQIGNILDRKEQLPLEGAEQSEGIFAPTLRYHDGTFYMITTNVSSELGNFIVTAKDPAGPWSDPYPLESEGIDPSLFFDDDGKCYYCGTKPRREGSRYFGDNEIYIQELDLNTMKLVGESYPAWHGALRQVEWPEGPHIYKHNGWYYLMISEAGTGHNHAISVARSKSLFEPFIGNPGNPICTHRHLGYNYPIVNVGHPDIVETDEGEWWMVLLASRPYGGYYRNMGRETFIAKMEWEGDWPIVNPFVGKIEDTFEAPDLPAYPVKEVPETEDFNESKLSPHFLYLRNPIEDNYSLTNRPGYMQMKLTPVTAASKYSPSALLVRQQHKSFLVETKLDLHATSSNETAGLLLNQSQSYNYQFLLTGDHQLVLTSVKKDVEETLMKKAIDISGELTLRVVANEQDLTFSYSTDGTTFNAFMEHVDARMLCTDVAGGFVGTCVGIYASSNNQETTATCDFDYLTYKQQ